MGKTIYILAGPAGCGKSTWAAADVEMNRKVLEEINEPDDSIIISRDVVRFSIITDKDDYFSKETEVFETFVKQINDAIYDSKYGHIYVDATHLSIGSRKKLLNDIAYEECHVVGVNFLVNEETVVAQNAQRTGRALVPEDVVRKMCKAFVPISKEVEPEFNFVLNIER